MYKMPNIWCQLLSEDATLALQHVGLVRHTVGWHCTNTGYHFERQVFQSKLDKH